MFRLMKAGLDVMDGNRHDSERKRPCDLGCSHLDIICKLRSEGRLPTDNAESTTISSDYEAVSEDISIAPDKV